MKSDAVFNFVRRVNLTMIRSVGTMEVKTAVELVFNAVADVNKYSYLL